MTMTKTTPFAEMRDFLQRLGYKEKCINNAHVFYASVKHMLFFRRYGDREAVDPGDITSTRQFLDAWGQLDAADFDAFVESPTKPAKAHQ